MRSIEVVHATPEAVVPDASTPGSVVAEIGGDRGAVVVHVPPNWSGREIEIRHVSERWTGSHVSVLARRLAQHDDYSAFFPSLQQGDYEVRCRQPIGLGGQAMSEVRTLRVLAGCVVDHYWDVTVPRT
jgi:hypothetical protein